jgi:hypothetical protein
MAYFHDWWCHAQGGAWRFNTKTGFKDSRVQTLDLSRYRKGFSPGNRTVLLFIPYYLNP